MNMDNALRPCGLMKAIDVLRAEKEAARITRPFERCQCQVRRIRLCAGRPRATVRVIPPYPFRVAFPGLYIRQFIMAVPAPACALKNGYPALSADAGAGQDKDARVCGFVSHCTAKMRCAALARSPDDPITRSPDFLLAYNRIIRGQPSCVLFRVSALLRLHSRSLFSSPGRPSRTCLRSHLMARLIPSLPSTSSAPSMKPNAHTLTRC